MVCLRQFYEDNPKAIFDSLPFNQRMSIVDEFVKAKVRTHAAPPRRICLVLIRPT